MKSYKGLTYIHKDDFDIKSNDTNLVNRVIQFKDTDCYYSVRNYYITDDYEWPGNPTISNYWTFSKIKQFIDAGVWIPYSVNVDINKIDNMILEFDILLNE